MKVGGEIIRLMERVDLSMQMGIFMTEIGRTTKLMVMVFIATLMVLGTRGTGRKTSNMGGVSRHGPMELVTKVTMWKVKNMGSESLHGQTKAHITDSSLKTTLMEKVKSVFNRNNRCLPVV